MTSLTIQCPLPCDRLLKRERGTPLTLQFVEDHDYDEEEWIVKDVTLLHIGSQSMVLRANILRPEDAPLDAVLKVDPTGERHDSFVKEAEAYQGKGRGLQGDILPVFYGCFQTRIGSKIVACLVTEYCGEPMQNSLDEVNGRFRGELLLNVLTMHYQGMSHGDLYERNILVNNGHPVLIDLELSEDHKCGLRLKTVPGAMRPTVEEYGCPELHDLVCRMGIWKHVTVHFCVHNIDKNSIQSVDDIKCFIQDYHGPEKRKLLEERANKLYKELCAERLLTYGTEKISPGQKRIDWIELESPQC